MSLFKCKICGGALDVADDSTVAECKYCGAKQTVSSTTDEDLSQILDRVDTLYSERNAADAAADVSVLLKRVFVFLEDGDWRSASEYSERVLDKDPENALAYLGKLMAQQRVRTRAELKNCSRPFDNSAAYQRLLRYADKELVQELISYRTHIVNRNASETYDRARTAMSEARSKRHYKNAAELFESIPDYRDAAALAGECRSKMAAIKKDEVLNKALSKMKGDDPDDYVEAANLLSTIPGWRNADEQLAACKSRIKELEQERLRWIEQAKKDAVVRNKRTKRTVTIVAVSVGAGLTLLAVLAVVLCIVLFSFFFGDRQHSRDLSAKNVHTVLEVNEQAPKPVDLYQ